MSMKTAEELMNYKLEALLEECPCSFVYVSEWGVPGYIKTVRGSVLPQEASSSPVLETELLKRDIVKLTDTQWEIRACSVLSMPVDFTSVKHLNIHGIIEYCVLQSMLASQTAYSPTDKLSEFELEAVVDTERLCVLLRFKAKYFHAAHW